jgi:hypothetical protein
MAIRGTNIFALLQDSDDEDKPAPKVAPAAVAKLAKSTPVSLPPAPKKADPRPAQDPVSEPAKPQTRGPEKKAKPVQDDRHSKTGRGKEMKKDGQGAHNWGGEAVGKKQGPNAGGGRDKPAVEDLTETVEQDIPEVEQVEGEKEVAAAPVTETAKPDPKKTEEPDFAQLRREEEEKARKEAASFRTYKEYLGAEEVSSEDKPKTNVLLGFMGAEGNRGGRGRGRGRRPEPERKKEAALDLKDQFAFPKLG